MVREFWRDLVFGGRLLRRSPGFAGAAVLSLGLGIGGATAVFTLVNAIVLRTLPVPDPQQLYQASARVSDKDHSEIFSYPSFDHVREAMASSRAAEVAAATGIINMQFQPDGESVGARGNAQLVSGEYFALLRQTPQLGRLLTPADNTTVGGHPVAVVSDAYWRRVLGASPDAIGRHLTINGTSFTIVGVTSPHFFGTTLALRAPDAWVPLMMQPAVHYASNVSSGGSADQTKPWPPQQDIEWLNIFVRAASASAAANVATTVTTIVQRDREAALPKDATPDDHAFARRGHVVLNDASAGVSGLRDSLTNPLYVLLSMVVVLLVIACGNVAGLLLARGAGREREMAIRLSIGASRSRLVRQLLAESLLLAAAGGAAGMTFAMWSRDGLLALMVNVGSGAAVDLNTTLDWRVLTFASLASLATGMACGVLPAFRSTRVAVSESLKQQGRAIGGEGRRGLMVGKTLVAAQMAFCLLLLVVAGLFARTLTSLIDTNIGFDRAHVLGVRVDIRGAGYSPEERQALYTRLVDRLQGVPSVQSASLSLNGPLISSQRIGSMSVEGHEDRPNEQLRTNEEIVTDKYFQTVGLRIIQGRDFGPEDRSPDSHNSIVNETMAHRFFPGQSAIGKRWTYGGPIGKDAQVIVGVVEDARYTDVRTAPPNMVYHLAASRLDDVMGDIEIRTAGSPDVLAQTIRQTLNQIEPRLPITEIAPLTARIARGTLEDRMVARLTSIFGGLALLLACLGLYGTISYGVSRRVAELGLRMALGADRRMVLTMVMREALTLVVLGVGIGLPLAFAAAKAVSALLYRVDPGDPLSFGLGAGLLVTVAALAAYLPAYRASRIEPMVALGR
jgi:predicted permease